MFRDNRASENFRRRQENARRNGFYFSKIMDLEKVHGKCVGDTTFTVNHPDGRTYTKKAIVFAGKE